MMHIRTTIRYGRVMRRGLTLVEFMLAISITAVIATAVTAMLTAVAQSTDFDRSMREMVVRGQAMNVRLASYVAPSRFILDSDKDSLALWLDDTRKGETVHATEVRWIDYDAATQSIRMHYVNFPSTWSQMDRDLMDLELAYPDTDWWLILLQYQMMGYTSTIRLCDSVSTFQVDHQSGERLVTFGVTFDASAGGHSLIAAGSIRDDAEPIR